MSFEGSYQDGFSSTTNMLKSQPTWLPTATFKPRGSTRDVLQTPVTNSVASYLFPSPMPLSTSPLRSLTKRPHSLISNHDGLFSPEPSPHRERFTATASGEEESLLTNPCETSPISMKRLKVSEARENFPFPSPKHSSFSNSTSYRSPNSSQPDFNIYFLTPQSTQATSSDYENSFRQNIPSFTHQSQCHGPSELRRASYASTFPETDHKSEVDARVYFSEVPVHCADQLQVPSPSNRLGYSPEMNSLSPWTTPLSSPTKVLSQKNNAEARTRQDMGEIFYYDSGTGFTSPSHVPMLSLFTTESLNEALMIIGYLRQESLKRDPGPKDRNIWSLETLFAFEEAIRTIPRLGRAKLLALTPEGKRPFGRNELIADYIYRRTGIERDRKQVSSHIQVLKNSKKVQPLIAQLLRPAQEGESIAFNDCTASWYGACITGDVLTLHACTPEFPFPSQVLIHLPAIKNDRDYRNFLQNARELRKSVPNKRMEYDSLSSNSNLTRDLEIRVIASKQDSSIIKLTCNEFFKKALESLSTSEAAIIQTSVPYEFSTPSAGKIPERVFTSQGLDSSSKHNFASRTLDRVPSSDILHTPFSALNFLLGKHDGTGGISTPGGTDSFSRNTFLSIPNLEEAESSSEVPFKPLLTMTTDRSTIPDCAPNLDFSIQTNMPDYQGSEDFQQFGGLISKKKK
ncbi:hypothetical protein CROQUDRAFT_136471 [Cronartium quercuum f. sp. fusiforme G11]|uniref:TEA domain-containing protein n=1 Tax=Cronartium quercuum f. sp. fusiforme G11 TaxID=708437 RepID=A0A9P6N6V1_9BASI|nr:hypothetical protein CROQUDRAFT_136471 [Cronartium quercuum f. sp. fusiforme G11]